MENKRNVQASAFLPYPDKYNLLKNNNITLDRLSDFPTMDTLYRECNKIKVQAHSDYITDKIQTYGLHLDIMVEAKAKELTVQEYMKNLGY